MKPKIAVVILDGSRYLWDFLTDLDVTKGDLVLCDTRVGMLVGRVHEVKDESEVANKWLVSKIDIETHQRRVDAWTKEQQEVLCNGPSDTTVTQ